MYHVETIIPAQGQVILSELVTLLQDAVASGASVGFLPPLSDEEAREYWTSVLEGIGRLLMEAIEPIARELGRTLLVLDTRSGDNAERLYRKLRYVEVGIIPSYYFMIGFYTYPGTTLNT